MNPTAHHFTLQSFTPRARRFVASLVAGASLFIGALEQEAQACDCIAGGVAYDFARHDHVFVGQVLFGLQLPDVMLYLTTVERSYTGCASEGGVRWLQTDADASSCAARFATGERYLLFANDVSGVYGFAPQTDDCSGNMGINGVSPEDLAYLETRKNCCNESCACQPGVEEFSCEVDPCSLATPCEGEGQVRCEVNNCGGCEAEFYNSDGGRACLGNEEKDPRCVDHKDHEFGDCDAYPGWLVLDGRCQLVVSGCDTLVPGSMPVFESKQDCQSACNLESPSFSCGEQGSCETGTSYCQRSIPGAQPPPGEPTEYFDCLPLPESCINLPSCNNCFEVTEGGYILTPDGFPADCQDDGQGAVNVSVAYP